MRAIAVASALYLVVTALSGCAGTVARPVVDDSKATGIRYYELAPFLLVYSDSKGGLKSALIYLPDTMKMRTVKPYAFLANNNSTLTFDKGALKKAEVDIDQTAVPKAAIETIKSLAVASLAAADTGGARADKDRDTVPTPQLYRIIRSDEGVWKVSGTGIAVNADGTEFTKLAVRKPGA